MYNLKIIYFNIETIDREALESILSANQCTISHYTIKPGLILINYQGTAQELYKSLGDFVKDKSILILDLKSETNSYYGFMNKDIWNWLNQNIEKK